ncbi:hypothetical protein AKJ52_00725 [candidate division MSBL1 archaeon SCGC-AAA382C18]|uniref:Thioredoxin domain-containing protein n=1 Tax=candidate division MSBL1 archaeon SCGC-AAA382C18 TaxID=1698281 RepID=A0A133VL68_9EURY|nr:hypothetical protein AKJ52_00725 [candidate division MSBL1 archaeon SCGC-AAA382C18]
MVLELTDENFEKKVLEHDGLVLVDFWGSWCTACQQMKPIVEKLEKKYDDDEIRIGHLNIDKNPQISARYEIEETPTHILFEDGEVVERKMGAMADKQLERMFNNVLGK